MTIETPLSEDILFGRDSDSLNHEGNRRFRIVVAAYQKEYHSTTGRVKKTQIVAKIVEEIKSSGSRFLKRNSRTNKWDEVERKACVEKVCSSLHHSLVDEVTPTLTFPPSPQVGHAIRDQQAIAERKIQNKKTSNHQLRIKHGQSNGAAVAHGPILLQAILAQQHEERQHLLAADPGISVLPDFQLEILRAQSLPERSAERDLLLASRVARIRRAQAGENALLGMFSARDLAATEAMLARRAGGKGGDSAFQWAVATEALFSRRGSASCDDTALELAAHFRQRVAVAEELAASRQRRALVEAMVDNQTRKMDVLRASLMAQNRRPPFSALPHN
jgi:hypothetical protein